MKSPLPLALSLVLVPAFSLRGSEFFQRLERLGPSLEAGTPRPSEALEWVRVTAKLLEASRPTQSWLGAPSRLPDHPSVGFFAAEKEPLWGPLLQSLRLLRAALLQHDPDSTRAREVQRRILALFPELPRGTILEEIQEWQTLSELEAHLGDLEAALTSIARARAQAESASRAGAEVSQERRLELLLAHMELAQRASAPQVLEGLLGELEATSEAPDPTQLPAEWVRLKVRAHQLGAEFLATRGDSDGSKRHQERARRAQGVLAPAASSKGWAELERCRTLASLHQFDDALFQARRAHQLALEIQDFELERDALLAILDLALDCRGCVLPKPQETLRALAAWAKGRSPSPSISGWLESLRLEVRARTAVPDLPRLDALEALLESWSHPPKFAPLARIRTLLRLALEARQLSRPEVALRAGEEALEALGSLRPQAGTEAGVLYEQAFLEHALALRSLGRWQAQAKLYQRELNWIESQAKTRTSRWAWRQISRAESLGRSFQPEEARAALDQADPILEALGPLEGLAHSQWLRALTWLDQGQPEEAAQALRRCIHWTFQLDPLAQQRDPRAAQLLGWIEAGQWQLGQARYGFGAPASGEE